MLNIDLTRLRPQIPGFPATIPVQTQPVVVSRRRPLSLAVVLAVLLFHSVLGPLMGRYPLLATLHVWVTLPLCLGLAGLGRRWETALIASAYLCGSEVLWRATGASFFWEGAKYAIGLVALITLLRRRNRSASLWPVVYFALLIPGVVLTVMRTDLFASRGLISANLSGPFALTLLVLAFGHREIAPESF